jgi:hypothetical protein
MQILYETLFAYYHLQTLIIQNCNVTFVKFNILGISTLENCPQKWLIRWYNCTFVVLGSLTQ